VLTAITRQARDLARELGRPVSEQIAEEVEQTLRAGLADPAAANAVLSGRLTSALTYAGFGEAEIADAVALGEVVPLPSAGREWVAREVVAREEVEREVVPWEASTREAGERDRAAREVVARQAAVREATIGLHAAQESARRAEGAALVAEQHRDALCRREASARQRLDHAHGRVAELESLLAQARQQVSAAAAGWAPLHAEVEAAALRAESARGLAESTRATLQAARAHLADVEQRAGS
jgi:hypothetical protein